MTEKKLTLLGHSSLGMAIHCADVTAMIIHYKQNYVKKIECTLSRDSWASMPASALYQSHMLYNWE